MMLLLVLTRSPCETGAWRRLVPFAVTSPANSAERVAPVTDTLSRLLEGQTRMKP